jgi:hypothetical protein
LWKKVYYGGLKKRKKYKGKTTKRSRNRKNSRVREEGRLGFDEEEEEEEEEEVSNAIPLNWIVWAFVFCLC